MTKNKSVLLKLHTLTICATTITAYPPPLPPQTPHTRVQLSYARSRAKVRQLEWLHNVCALAHHTNTPTSI